MEQRNSNKTIMSSVLFLDIVEYSKESVVGQISLKERFNRFLSEGLKKVPEADRIILDTGDGAAVSFIGDIEEALQASLAMRDNLLKQDSIITPVLRIRMGINLGPVRLVRDINGQPNIVGDGINVAQRIMAFAGENEILMSRSYYDAITQLSEHYKEMVRFKGSQTDKHVRAHEIYVVCQPGEVNTQPAIANKSAPTRNKLSLYIGGGVVALGLVAGLIFSNFGAEQSSPSFQATEVAASSVTPPAASTVQSSIPKAAASEVASIEHDHKASANNKSNSTNKANTNDKIAKPIKPTSSVAVTSVRANVTNSSVTKNTPSPAATPGEGRITIGCAEGSKVFIDGSNHGKVGSVPLSLTVTSGTHLVVIDSPNRLISQHVTIENGQTVRVGTGACN